MGEISNRGLQEGDVDLSQFHVVFFEEAAENLENMERMLLALDVATVGQEELNAIFRFAHSIKGGAATFGFSDVTLLTHELETLLDRVRRQELALTREMVDVLLEAGDTLRAQLAHRQGHRDDSPDTTELVARVQRLASGGGQPAAARSGLRHLRVRIGPLADPSVADNIAELFRDMPTLGTFEPLDHGQPDAAGVREYKVVTASTDAELVELFSFHVARDQVAIAPLDPQPAIEPAATMIEGDGFGFFVDTARLRAPPPVAAPEPTGRKQAVDRAASQTESTTLRVPVGKVDQLINLVGELVITQAMLTQQAKQLDPVQNQRLLTGISDLERSTRHLQEAVLSIRMIPMSFVFNRYPRMLRDLAAKLGKDIELKMVGEATELDKGVIEKIIDPLTHLVRNSADHGIEPRPQRIAAGKPPTGTITLAASHEGGSILIEVRDDGAGLSRHRILAKARERGLPTRDDMTDQEVWSLIWEPGFSTAEQISDVSGRGVGMDVVRKNIAALGGSVDIDSAEGYGTRVSVRLPLTLAIMDGMSIGVGGETYILPLASVVESFQIAAGTMQTVAGAARVVKVRDEYLPVASLAEVFAVPRLGQPPAAEIIVIVEAEGSRIALVADELLGQHQVVVKNLETNYRRVPNVSGATILGDGRVALIVDVAALIKRTRH